MATQVNKISEVQSSPEVVTTKTTQTTPEKMSKDVEANIKTYESSVEAARSFIAGELYKASLSLGRVVITKDRELQDIATAMLDSKNKKGINFPSTKQDLEDRIEKNIKKYGHTREQYQSVFDKINEVETQLRKDLKDDKSVAQIIYKKMATTCISDGIFMCNDKGEVYYQDDKNAVVTRIMDQGSPIPNQTFNTILAEGQKGDKSTLIKLRNTVNKFFNKHYTKKTKLGENTINAYQPDLFNRNHTKFQDFAKDDCIDQILESSLSTLHESKREKARKILEPKLQKLNLETLSDKKNVEILTTDITQFIKKSTHYDYTQKGPQRNIKSEKLNNFSITNEITIISPKSNKEVKTINESLSKPKRKVLDDLLETPKNAASKGSLFDKEVSLRKQDTAQIYSTNLSELLNNSKDDNFLDKNSSELKGKDRKRIFDDPPKKMVDNPKKKPDQMMLKPKTFSSVTIAPKKRGNIKDMISKFNSLSQTTTGTTPIKGTPQKGGGKTR